MAAPRYQLSGRVALITGPARGIGAETARQLAARGMKLGLAGLEPERIEALAAELPTETAWFECDVTDWDALRAAVSGTVQKLGGIDVVIANAGIAPWGPIRTIEPDAFEQTIEVNLLGVWRTIRAALPHVLERKGYVLPIASLAAAVHSPVIGHYNAAKAGIEGFADALRMEMRPYEVDVGCAYFGFLDTDMVRAPEEDEIFAEMQTDRSRGAMGRPAPVSKGVEAIVRGIERRARRVWYPPWIIAPLLAPAPFQRLIELGIARRGGFDMIKRLDERALKRAQSPV
ncbi:MAG TPA: short-chain dehydrogenase/reductase [Solirubrobacteraceae bacterium]|nr:short-chain dehydrogenase/reductase [Solirubrobacteraceae bacterium]